jgi:hypothetical protein
MRIRLIIMLMLACASAHAQLILDVEGGVVTGTSYNKVRIPNADGSLVNLASDLSSDSKAFYRIRAGYLIGKRHFVSALYAPLTLRYDGSFSRDVLFNNLNFPAGQPLTVHYKFNSSRLTYRYDFVLNGRWRVGAGLTGKIRDADVRFRNESEDTHYDNIGFVPLINFYASYKPSYRWMVILEGDALAARAGRAEDIFGGLSYQVNNKLGIKLGYRMLEGGADNDKIYNFSWINYASAGLLISL